jgi:hypothetical protein
LHWLGSVSARSPAAAAEQWVGYTSQYIAYDSTKGDQNFTATVDFGLPTHLDGSPCSGPFTWQAAVGGRQLLNSGPPAPDAPVDCENSLTTGFGGPSGPEWMCVDDQFPATLGVDSSLATRDARITSGSPTTAAAGTVATVAFNLAYAGTATPAATFTLGAARASPAPRPPQPGHPHAVHQQLEPGRRVGPRTGQRHARRLRRHPDRLLPDGETRAGTAQLLGAASQR